MARERGRDLSADRKDDAPPPGDGEPLEGPPRLEPGRPLPPYRYVPGRDPHPVRHPGGYLHGRESEPPAPGSAEWRVALRYGVDLFNHHDFWAAHETWETLWHTLPRDTPLAQALQGLIQLAAAMLKHEMSQERPRDTLASAAARRLLAAQDQGCHLVPDLQNFLARCCSFWASSPGAASPLLLLEEPFPPPAS